MSARTRACTLLVHILPEAIQGHPEPLRDRHFEGHTAIPALAAGSWRYKLRYKIRSSGYVVHTLEAALWAVGTTSTFEEAVVLAVNLGDDADTAGAVTGQIAGALYGFSAIPQRWLEPLVWREQIIKAADDLLRVAP